MARPRRTCVGCRTTADKDQLVRLVARPSVAVDLPQRAPGRGAYLHPGPACVALAIRRRAVPRALRTSGFDPDELLRQWQAVQEPSARLA